MLGIIGGMDVIPNLMEVDGVLSGPVAHLIYEVSLPDVKGAQREEPSSAEPPLAEEPVLKRPASCSVPNLHLSAREYAFSVQQQQRAAPNLYAHVRRALAQAVNTFHVQPRQDC